MKNSLNLLKWIVLVHVFSITPGCIPIDSEPVYPTLPPFTGKIKTSYYTTLLKITYPSVYTFKITHRRNYNYDENGNLLSIQSDDGKYFKIERLQDRIVVRDSSAGVAVNTGNVITLVPNTKYIDSIYFYEGGSLFSTTKVTRDSKNRVSSVLFKYMTLGNSEQFTDFIYDERGNLSSFKKNSSAGAYSAKFTLLYDLTKPKIPLTDPYTSFNNLAFGRNDIAYNVYLINDVEILGVKFGELFVNYPTKYYMATYLGASLYTSDTVKNQLIEFTPNLVRINLQHPNTDTLINTYY